MAVVAFGFSWSTFRQAASVRAPGRVPIATAFKDLGQAGRVMPVARPQLQPAWTTTLIAGCRADSMDGLERRRSGRHARMHVLLGIPDPELLAITSAITNEQVTLNRDNLPFSVPAPLGSSVSSFDGL